MEDDEFLQVKNFVLEIVTNNRLSTDNFETIVTQLFLNQITDLELMEFLEEKLRGLKFVPISELVQVIYFFFTQTTQDEERHNTLIVERNRLLIQEYKLQEQLEEQTQKLEEMQKHIEGARDNETKRIIYRFCAELRTLQCELDALLDQERASVLEVLLESRPSLQKMAMFTLKTSEILKSKDIRSEAFQLSNEIARMARKTHQSEIIGINEAKRGFSRVLKTAQTNVDLTEESACELAEEVIYGTKCIILGAIVLLIGTFVCIVKQFSRFSENPI